MTMYKHSTTGALAELIEDGGSHLKIKDVATDEIKELSAGTFKRWWKPVDDETADEELLGLNEEPEEVENDKQDAAESEASEQDASETESAASAEPQPESEDDQDATSPLTLSAVIEKLEDLFDLLNGIYFDGKLARPVITVQSTPRLYGHCTTQKVWKTNAEGEDEAYYEINIGAEYLSRSSDETAATMCHEMIHLHCRENNLVETCQNGRYHNKFFKKEAELRDLIIGYNRSIGYSITTPSEAFVQKLRDAEYELEVPFARHTIGYIKPESRREKQRKYFCDVCGQSFRTTAKLNLICGTCEIPMECAE